MKKKGIALLLTAALTASMLTGCGSGQNQGEEGKSQEAGGKTQESGTETQASSEAPADDLSQARTFSAWLFPDDYKYYSGYGENPVVKYLCEKFNTTIEFQQPPMGSEQDQFNLMMGTGEYTDVMEVTYSQDSVSNLYQDGVIVDLAPYIDLYMPNYKEFLQKPENEDIYKAMYDENGHSFSISAMTCDEPSLLWGGLVYRRDILETMTGGNVAFPSGKEEPVTVEDWEYMLELMNQYFQAAGLADYACLILPYQGYFGTSELLNGFGTCASFMVKDDKVVFGPTSQEFYNYLVKMHEWYEKGWIYKDFASRTNDLFFLPNTALTYGGAAGVWFGMSSQVDDQLSMPEYNLIVDVHPMAPPLDTANGQDGSASGTMGLEQGRAHPKNSSWAVSSTCSEENLIRFLTIADYLYSEEGAKLKTFGLNAEQAANDALYQEKGVEGSYYFDEQGNYHKNELFLPNEEGETLDWNSFTGTRLPGLSLNSYSNSVAKEYEIRSSNVWRTYGADNNFPAAATPTAEENAVLTKDYTNYTDYMNSMIPKFIMGTEELTEETFAAFVKQMNAFGAEECTQIYQDIYDRFNSK